MPSHSALLYVLLPNFINELQISSYQFSYTFAKSIPSSISLDLNTLNSLKRLFFTGYFSIFLIKKELFFQIPRKYPGKKRRIFFLLRPSVFYNNLSFFYRYFKYTINWCLSFIFNNYCIKLVLLTYQNRDLKHYFRMKKGLITSIKPVLLKWPSLTRKMLIFHISNTENAKNLIILGFFDKSFHKIALTGIKVFPVFLLHLYLFIINIVYANYIDSL